MPAGRSCRLAPSVLRLVTALALGGATLGLAPAAHAATDYSGIRINEVESNGDAVGDWVELTNAGSAPVDISGLKLLDSDNGHSFDVVASGTTLGVGGFYAIYVDSPQQSPGFGLGSSDSVRLYAPSATSGTDPTLDSYTWTAHASTTYGRCPDGTGAFVTTTAPTRGTANACPGSGSTPADYSGIKINEIESSDPNGGPDWVELTNTSKVTVDISGLKLLDNDDTHSFQVVPSGTTLAAGGFYALDTSFGLGAPDSVRLYPPSATKASDTPLDTYAWQSHASVTYGRCPDGTGSFTTTVTATKGAANDCPGPIQTSPWPGGADVTVADRAGAFGENLSGLVYQGSGSSSPGTLWAVKNGPGTLYKLVRDGGLWVPAGGDWAAGKNLDYTNGSGDPDAEGVTFTGAGPSAGIYVSTERDNDVKDTSRPAVLEYLPDTSGTSLTAVHDWNLTPDLPGLGANLGLEGVTWVPDGYLTQHGLIDQGTQAAYDPSRYPKHGDGLFLVGVEQTGKVYAYVLNSDDTFQQIAVFDSGFPSVMDLHWDTERQDLWVVCDDTCGGDIGTFTVHGDGRFANDVYYARPNGMPNLNNEGFTIAAQTECVNGREPAYWSDDTADDGHALRQGSVDCTALPAPKQATTTTASFEPDNSVRVAVAPTAGTGTPSGSVTLSVTGGPTSTADLVNGVATFAAPAPRDQAEVDVSATYSGDDAFTGSSDTAERVAPTLRGDADSTPNAHGWVDHDVTVTWTCTEGSASLVGGCPAPTTLGQGRDQTASQTITAHDGATASRDVGPFDIDETAPTVRVAGVHDGQTVHGATPDVSCAANDELSGVTSCDLQQRRSGRTVHLTVTATDEAGNAATAKAVYRLAPYRIIGAPGGHAAFRVEAGRGYTVLVTTRREAPAPSLMGPRPANRSLTGPGRTMRRADTVAGAADWRGFVKIPAPARPGSTYRLRVALGGHRHHDLTLRVRG